MHRGDARPCPSRGGPYPRAVRISVVVPTVRLRFLRTALASLQAQTHPAFEIVLVGQGDDPELIRFGLRQALAGDRVRWVHLRERGVARARNAGLEAATGEIVAMVDDDCEARSDWLEVVDAAFREDPALDLLGGPLVAPPRTPGRLVTCPHLEVSEARYAPVPGAPAPPPGWDFIGANFAARRTLFDRVGVFDVHLGIGGTFPAGEETDLKLRCEALGIVMRSTPALVVHHSHGTREGLGPALASMRSYALGNGAIGAKLTLAGDPRGKEWVARVEREVAAAARAGRLPGAFREAVRLGWVRSGYRRCLTQFRLDGSGRYLVPLTSPRRSPRGRRPGAETGAAPP